MRSASVVWKASNWTRHKDSYATNLNRIDPHCLHTATVPHACLHPICISNQTKISSSVVMQNVEWLCLNSGRCGCKPQNTHTHKLADTYVFVAALQGERPLNKPLFNSPLGSTWFWIVKRCGKSNPWWSLMIHAINDDNPQSVACSSVQVLVHRYHE